MATSEFSAGVRPRSRKSARNPSSEIRIVVGPKSAVPFDSSVWDLACAALKPVDALYAPRRRMKKRTATMVKMNKYLVNDGLAGWRAQVKISEVQKPDGKFEDLPVHKDNLPFHPNPRTSH